MTASKAKTHYEEGCRQLRAGATEKALRCFEKAVEQDPECHEAYGAVAGIAASQGDVAQALGYYAMAAATGPQEPAYKAALVRIIQNFRVMQFNPDLKTLMAACLATPGIDCSPLGRAWGTMLMADPAFAPFFQKPLGEIKDYAPLSEPFFLDGLRTVVFSSSRFEDFLTALRRALLENDRLPEDLAVALAHYCFATEYVFYCSPEEQKAVEALRAKVEAGGGTPRDAAVLACYLPLYSLSCVVEADAGLLALQVTESQRLREMKGRITALTPIEDDVSKEVRAQYEEFPYPRWLTFTPGIKLERTEGFLQKKKDAKILIAGCGTGKEALELAAALPGSSITAVDLSLSSLAYAAVKAELHGIENISFRQADILKLGAVEERFDFIASSGVLHHMENPEKGWEIIVGLLRPGGVMRIALYSEAARAAIVKAREVIAGKGYGSSAEEIRRFRKDAPLVLDEKTLAEVRDILDYYSLSQCRDLLFHVQEHRFTVPRIEENLNCLGLEFLGFYLEDEVLQDYARKFPHDAQARNLANWDAYEKSNPATFIGMYRFWCRKA